jgi:uncharacterized protein (TIGR00251 family)
MRISIKVKANAKENKVEETGNRQFLVRVKAPAKEGKANKEVIEVLAEHFKVPKSCVTIITGLKSNRKIVSIESD